MSERVAEPPEGHSGDGSRAGARGGTQAVDRAALVVSTVVQADEPLAFADIADECELPKSTTSRLLKSLERTELVERNDSGSYVAGPLFWLYASRHDPWAEIARLARPVLTAAGHDSGETVNLGVVRGDRVVHVAQVDSTYLLGTRDWTEVEVPEHASALGKVLYAHGVLTRPSLPLDSATPHTITDPAAFDRDLAEVRERRYATTVDELEIGLAGVAAPVRGIRGEVVAALGISGPTQRLEGELDRLGELVIGHADRLSRMLRRRGDQRDPGPGRTRGRTSEKNEKKEGAA